MTHVLRMIHEDRIGPFAAGVQLRKREREIFEQPRELHAQTWTLRSHCCFAVHAESIQDNAASTAND